jgi:hypothetical protein
MKATDLQELNEQADMLAAKLKAINSRWAQLPSDDDLEDLDTRLASILGQMESIVKLANSDEFPRRAQLPSEDDFEDLDKWLASILGQMRSIIELANSDEFPRDD